MGLRAGSAERGGVATVQWHEPQSLGRVSPTPYAWSMTFTALHRALGVSPGPLTDELLEAAVRGGVVETNDLDWKAQLPPAKGLPQTDFPKDVAAMANSGGTELALVAGA